MKYFLFDVAGTLLYKPTLYTVLADVLQRHGHDIDLATIKYRHKIMSESIFFPDRTNAEFYGHFNREFLYALGLVPTDELMQDIFKSCSYLPWVPFEDTSFLKEINRPMGIISNFNSTLKEKLKSFFDVDFTDIFVSEELSIAKPQLAFYQGALDKIGVDPKDILYVGDSIKLDIEPASKLGIKALLIDRENYFPAQKNRITSLSELKNYL